MDQTFNPFGDLTKMIEQFKLPGVDIAALVEARRKDIEALVEANKAAYASMQALASKQTEVLTQTMQGLQDAAKGMAGGAGTSDPVKQADVVRGACEKALADMKELADLARNAQSDAMAHLTQRAAQSMQEIQRMTNSQAAPKK